jgi:hypothetical protein
MSLLCDPRLALSRAVPIQTPLKQYGADAC